MSPTFGGAPRPRQLPGRTQILVLLGVAAVLAIVLLIARVLNHKPEPAAAAAPPAGAFQATPEELANITVAPVRTMSFPAEVVTDGKVAVNDDRTTQIFPPFTGRVLKVLVSAGQTVRKGQPLATFAANEVIQAQSDLASARAAEHQAQAQLAQAHANFERQQALYRGDAAAQRDFEQARTDLAAAQQNLGVARANAAAAEGRINVLNLAPQMPALARAADSGRFLRQATLVSPIDGVVTQRQVGDGQFVSSVSSGAAQPILAVSDTRSLWLVANLREGDAASVRMGSPVTASLTALPGQSYAGRIDYVAPVVDPNTRRVLVHAVVANPSGLLRPEMFAQMSIQTGPPRTAIGVPASAVVYDGPKARVWLARPKGVFALREVTLGRSHDGYVEVVSGLSASDRVAVGGALFLDEAGKPGE